MNGNESKNYNYMREDKWVAVATDHAVRFLSGSVMKINRNLHPVAFILYAVIAFLYFALPVIRHFDTRYIGVSADPTQFMWSFRWIIYAITHKVNPFYTNLIWVPGGYDLSFKTFIPGISLLSIPITLWLGVVRTFNIWQILNPALGAYLAFVLCHHLTKRPTYSFLGGYVFGFSSYEIAQATVHLQMSTIFLIPLMVYLILLVGQNKITKVTFGFLFSLTLVFQFLFALEVFTTFTLFGVITVLISYLCVSDDIKVLMRKCIVPVAASYLVCLLVVSPYLFEVLRHVPKGALHNPSYYVNDLVNFIVPTPLTFLGRLFRSISVTFQGNWSKSDAYFGVGLLFIAILFAKSSWRKPQGRILFLAFIVPAVASLGPIVHILGKPSFPTPFYPLEYAPLIKDAQPNRMVLFASLPMAVMVAMWLSSRKLTWPRILLVSLSLSLMIPHFPYPSSGTGVPAFISTSEYKNYIPRGSNVLILPYTWHGSSMLWQADTNFYFTMASGYLGPPPSRNAYLPIVCSFFTGNPSPNLPEAVRSFIYSQNIKAIILDAHLSPNYSRVFDGLGVFPSLIGGVWIYQITDKVLQEIKAEDPSFEDVNYVSPYDQAFRAVSLFLQRGGDLSNLCPKCLEERGFLSGDFGYHTVATRKNLTISGQWIGNWGGDVAIGTKGDSESMVPIINKYKGIAKKIYFPYPKTYVPGVDTHGQLLMVFPRTRVLQY